MRDGLQFYRDLTLRLYINRRQKWLSRCHHFPLVGEKVQSPDEDDLHFPYVNETPKLITLPTGQTLSSVLLHVDNSDMEINNVLVIPRLPTFDIADEVYDADSEEDIPRPHKKKRVTRRKHTGKINTDICEIDTSCHKSC